MRTRYRVGRYTICGISRCPLPTSAMLVQTAESVIERCVLMATDPGDLVLDPTCGGATTAVGC